MTRSAGDSRRTPYVLSSGRSSGSIPSIPQHPRPCGFVADTIPIGLAIQFKRFFPEHHVHGCPSPARTDAPERILYALGPTTDKGNPHRGSPVTKPSELRRRLRLELSSCYSCDPYQSNTEEQDCRRLRDWNNEILTTTGAWRIAWRLTRIYPPGGLNRCPLHRRIIN